MNDVLYLKSNLSKKYPFVLCVSSTSLLGHQSFSLFKDGKNCIEEGISKVKQNRDVFCEIMDIPRNNLVLMDQIHGSNIELISDSDGQFNGSHLEKFVPKTDGIITNKRNIYLGVLTADCVPLMFYDPIKEICAGVHAGSKGTLDGIGIKTVSKMEELGASVENIEVVVGPCINQCCYDIADNKKKISEFQYKFGRNIVRQGFNSRNRREGVFLDLIRANIIGLVFVGIKEENIHNDFSLCTCCYKGKLFPSHYRSKYIEKKRRYKSILTVIGIKSN